MFTLSCERIIVPFRSINQKNISKAFKDRQMTKEMISGSHFIEKYLYHIDFSPQHIELGIK